MSVALRVQLLGRVEVATDNGTPIRLSGRHAQALFALLVLSRRPRSRDALATDLWPLLAATPREVHLVRAGRSDRWTPADLERPVGPRVAWHVVPDAGHWLHVDDPDGTFAAMAPTFARLA